MRNFKIAVCAADGQTQTYPMKQWLRDHPEILAGVDPSDYTSHQIRGFLRRIGWKNEQTSSDEILFPPSTPAEAMAAAIANTDARLEPEHLEEEDAEIAFELEYQLRDFIASNLGLIQVGSSRLSLFVDPSGRKGIEYPTDVGPIDILGVTPDGALYVFELKRASAPDKAIGQLARYMGWLQSSGMGHNGVHGIVVARQISPNLRFAASVIPNVSLFEYSIQFSLNPVSAVMKP